MWRQGQGVDLCPFPLCHPESSGAQSFTSSVAFVHKTLNILVLMYSGQSTLLNLLTLLLSAPDPLHPHFPFFTFLFFWILEVLLSSFSVSSAIQLKDMFKYLTSRCSEAKGFFVYVLLKRAAPKVFSKIHFLQYCLDMYIFKLLISNHQYVPFYN